MGIREHLLKKEEGDLKLSDLQLEMKESDEPVFDVEREVTEKEKTATARVLKSIRKDLTSYGYKYEQAPGLYETSLDRLGALVVVSPETFDGFDEMEKETWWRIGQEALERTSKNGLWTTFVQVAAGLRIVFPERLKQRNLGDCSEIVNELGLTIPEKNWSPAIFIEFKLAFPTDFEKMGFDMDGIYNELLGSLESYKKQKDWLTFAHLAEHFRILFPGQERELGLNKEVWQAMKATLESKRNDIPVFMEMAKRMMILVAEKVEVNEDGLKLVMPKEDFRQEKKPRPERKTF